MIAVALLLLQATPATPPPEPVSPTVVVRGRSLRQSGDALAACLARQCPPDQDVAASIAHAENQFVSGDYRDARTTLARSIGRNRRHAKQYPTEVSNLLRAQVRVSEHLGDAEAERARTLDAYQALKSGMKADSPALLAQQLETGDMQARLPRVYMARDTYERVARRAHAAGLLAIEGHALLRLAVMYAALQDVDPSWSWRTRATLARIAKTTEPELKPFRDAGLLLAAQLADRNGDKGAIDRMIAELARNPGDRPMLVFAPSYQPEFGEQRVEMTSQTARMNVDRVDGQWVDIRFRIRPDGSVADADIVRASPTLEKAWVGPVLTSIAARRYTPFAALAGMPGKFHVERYTRTARETTVTGSLIKDREPTSRIEMLDLTVEKSTDRKPGASH